MQKPVAVAGNPRVVAVGVHEVVPADHPEFGGLGQLDQPVVGTRPDLDPPAVIPPTQSRPLVRGQTRLAQERPVRHGVHLDRLVARVRDERGEQIEEPTQVHRTRAAQPGVAHDVGQIDHEIRCQRIEGQPRFRSHVLTLAKKTAQRGPSRLRTGVGPRARRCASCGAAASPASDGFVARE
jgi:hypothetical protein